LNKKNFFIIFDEQKHNGKDIKKSFNFNQEKIMEKMWKIMNKGSFFLLEI
jgi:hypothetical protein